MEARHNNGGFFRRMREKIDSRRALRRAKKLMGRKALSAKERMERDLLVSKLAENRKPGCAEALREWAVSGSVWLRPDPDGLGRAIGMSGIDRGHVMHIVEMVSGAKFFEIGVKDGNAVILERKIPVYEQYYLVRLLSAELDEVLQNSRYAGIMAILQERVSRILGAMEKNMPEMVESFWRAREARRD